MNKQDYKIHIIGGGVSGLTAAQVLEDHGYSPRMIEGTDRIGGRLKTDVVDGYQLDHGFQVLLTAYPAARKYLDYEALELQTFLPGASIFKNRNQKIIGDPLRDISLLFSTLFSGIGTFADKLKIMKLNFMLKRKSITEIFSEEEKTTLAYLTDLKFSNEIINDFFKPFFCGIFLELELSTSSRMFEFVYKMFGEGSVCIPKAGMEAIPKQLLHNLKNTTLSLNTRVESVNDKEIILKNNKRLQSDFAIIATDASHLAIDLEKNPIKWKSCHNLYFEVENRVISQKLIGLIPKCGALINNIFYGTSLKTVPHPKKECLSVTVIDNKGLSNSELIERVKQELIDYCSIENCTLLKYYSIPIGLPELSDVQYEISPDNTSLTDRVFLAGDTQLNGSLNAAIISGERAAQGVLEAISSFK
jgi:protoporphyrinogen oxidase